MATLGRAVAQEIGEHVPAVIRHDLDLDMPRPLDESLEEQALVAERARREPTRARERLAQPALVANRLHPDPTAAGDGLDHHRKAGRARGGDERLVALVVTPVAGQHRYLGALRDRLRHGLVAERGEDARRRADETHTRGLDRAREARALR